MQDKELWWYVFGIAFVTTAMIETFVPFRSLPSRTVRRWTANSVLQGAHSLVVICAYLLTGIALASTTFASSHGLLNLLPLPYALKLVLGLLAMDLTGYAGHRLMHEVATLWRVHQVHHTETDIDLTTGFRFHPLEALVQQGLLLMAIAFLGIAPAAVAINGFIVIVENFFSHGNILVPEKLDRLLRTLIITPGLHRMHHSEGIADQNANLGVVFSFWDRLFGTYLDQPSRPQMRSGLTEIANGSDLGPVGLLILPFQRTPKQNP